MAEVDEVLKKIQGYKGVRGTLIVSSEGIPIKTNLDDATVIQLVAPLHNLINHTKSTVHNIDPQTDLQFMRVHTKKGEILIATDTEYSMLTVQEDDLNK